MLHATIDVARRADRAEIDFCAIAGGVGTPNGIDVLEAGGGRALFGSPGSPLNKVLGLGLYGPVTDEDLTRIESFYRARQAPTQIELCPLAYGDLPARLCARGYTVEGFENELGLELGPASDASNAVGFNRPDTRVMRTTGDDDDIWLRVVAEGFASFEPLVGGAPESQALTTEQLMGMMSQFGHRAITRYIAWVDDQPAGGGAAWTHDGVLGIFGTATLPRFRRRGIQTAVTLAAIEDARGEADLAIATVAPGSTSQRTFERLGFQVLYTRAIFVKT